MLNINVNMLEIVITYCMWQVFGNLTVYIPGGPKLLQRARISQLSKRSVFTHESGKIGYRSVVNHECYSFELTKTIWPLPGRIHILERLTCNIFTHTFLRRKVKVLHCYTKDITIKDQ